MKFIINKFYIVGPADYHTEVGNLSFESAKRFKNEKMFDYLKFYKSLTLLSDDDECTLTDERKVMDEKKCLIYHAVFKSRVDRLENKISSGHLAWSRRQSIKYFVNRISFSYF